MGPSETPSVLAQEQHMDEDLDSMFQELEDESKKISQKPALVRRKAQNCRPIVNLQKPAKKQRIQDPSSSLPVSNYVEPMQEIDEVDTSTDLVGNEDFDPSVNLDSSADSNQQTLMQDSGLNKAESAQDSQNSIAQVKSIQISNKPKPNQVLKPSAPVSNSTVKASEPAITAPAASNHPATKQEGWFSARENVKSQHSEISKDSTSLEESEEIFSSCAEPSGNLLMYWFDAYEGPNGSIFIFGKVKNRNSGQFLSACTNIHGLKRKIYILPRQNVVRDDNITDELVTKESIKNELQTIMSSHGIKNWTMSETTKKYAFEVPGIPNESEWIEINYPYNEPQLQPNLTGATFSHTFGSNTSAMERLLIDANLMGPCWIELQNFKAQSRSSSWCKIEGNMEFMRSEDGQFNIRPLTSMDLDDSKMPEFIQRPPPFTAMSISMKTVMNSQTNLNEIAMISLMVHHSVNIDGATSESNQKNVSCITLIRQLENASLPLNFNETCKDRKMNSQFIASERGLLNCAIANIHRFDPDIYVGHNFVGFDLDVLLHRMRHFKIDKWSRIGRLRRSQFPKLQAGVGGMGESTFAERQVVSGRLMCDSYLMSRDLVKAKSYSLSNLTSQELKIERPEVDYEKVPQFYANAGDLVWLMQHCENDAYLSMRLIYQLMAIPLTKQLTNLAGNLWSRTLLGGRSERNEYLLLHEFTKSGYVVPDRPSHMTNNSASHSKKPTKSKDPKTAENNQSNEEDLHPEDDIVEQAKTTSSRRKPAYSGGLVLEPKKGLYDKYVLLLDFNSLYPSIIQEFNICFTTVKRNSFADSLSDELPELPEAGLPQGILPKLLATLVQRRKQVKGIMKSTDKSSDEYAQLNIRQQALKLTANSMYGCLGFTKSRFFAKPMAMLITAKGREILQNTVKEAEENLGLDVIYGDTDSIMVYTATENLTEVKQMGQKLKAAVNKKYKLLEIEMDGFFRRMLLLMKKKYAAVTVSEGPKGPVFGRETKGLDLVRRDWCGLSHDISEYVLQQILSDIEHEIMLDNIHSYLRKAADDIREGKVPLEKYIITKSLTKSPDEYNDAKIHPHVQVALRLKAKGIAARTGDLIPFIICIDEDPSKPYAQRAYHPDEIKKPDSGLKIDLEYYFKTQIHPPVSRLCIPIDGTDDGLIAECLGLDPKKFKSSSRSSHERDDYIAFDSLISDSERFKNVEKLSIICYNCKSQHVINELIPKESPSSSPWMSCQNCDKLMTLESIGSQINQQIRKFITKYMQNWMICDEPSCGERTRRLRPSATCFVKRCPGTMRQEYSDSDLFTQLQYFSAMVDVERYLRRIKDSEERDRLQSVFNPFRVNYDKLFELVRKYLRNNARGFVDLKSLFSFQERYMAANVAGQIGR